MGEICLPVSVDGRDEQFCVDSDGGRLSGWTIRRLSLPSNDVDHQDTIDQLSKNKDGLSKIFIQTENRDVYTIYTSSDFLIDHPVSIGSNLCFNPEKAIVCGKVSIGSNLCFNPEKAIVCGKVIKSVPMLSRKRQITGVAGVGLSFGGGPLLAVGFYIGRGSPWPVLVLNAQGLLVGGIGGYLIGEAIIPQANESKILEYSGMRCLAKEGILSNFCIDDPNAIHLW